MASAEHIPVLAKELLDLLQLEREHTVVDLTLGRSGHAQEVIKQLDTQGHFIGIDADSIQIDFAKQILTGKPKIDLVVENFAYVQKVLKTLDISSVDRIYADLGLSTVQLLNPERGFSFLSSQALDMRLNRDTQRISAADIVNTFSEEELAKLFWDLAEETFSRQIAKVIVTERKTKPFHTAQHLAQIIASVKRGHRPTHPATQVFQALRMYVNDELGTLKTMLNSIPNILSPNGIFAIITFHSIEDRIVKNVFKEWKATNQVTILTKKVIKPTWEERKSNPRARSAHLRAVKKVK